MSSLTVPPPPSCQIWTEGKTDWLHLKRAQRDLGRADNISYHEREDAAMGDCALLAKCKTFCLAQQSIPQIFIFDRDNPAILKEVVAAPFDYKDWGNNVFSFALPIPNHRAGHANFCVELYYSDATLRTEDSHGRRIFLTSEFDETGFLLSDTQVRVGNRNVLKGVIAPHSAKIVDSEVFRGARSIALSKADFGEEILKGTAPFASVDFSTFTPVFEVIDRILDSARPKTDPVELNPEHFFEALDVLESRAEQIIRTLETTEHVISMALHLFIAATVRVYEQLFAGEPPEHSKKVRPIKKILAEKYTHPSLNTVYALARSCFHLLDETAPLVLQSMKALLGQSLPLGAVGDFLDDLEELLPQTEKSSKAPGRMRLVHKSQTTKRLLEFVVPEFAMHAAKSTELLTALESRDEQTLAAIAAHGRAALAKLTDVLSPMFDQEFAVHFIEELDAATRNYVVRTRVYAHGTVAESQRPVSPDELDDVRDATAMLVIDHASGQSLQLAPFFVLFNGRLLGYKRTRLRGYEYQSASGVRVHVFDTKRKFFYSVFRNVAKAGPQSLFWTEVVPDVNPTTRIRANIPAESYDAFFGRERQIRQIREEILDIPNQNGIVFGVGGVGKTALMIELTLRLFQGDITSEIGYDNIVWMSAKTNYYNPIFDSVEAGMKQFDSLDTIVSSLLNFFELSDLEEYLLAEKKEFLFELLKENRVLLVLDNFETISKAEAEAIIRFLEVEAKKALRREPHHFKVIITSRMQIPSGFHQIELGGLDVKASKKLMGNLYQLYKRSEKSDLTNEQKEVLVNVTSGIPILTKHCYGQIFEFNRMFDSVTRDIAAAGNKAVEFSFGEILRHLAADACQLEILLLLASHGGEPLVVRQIAEILEKPEAQIESCIPVLINLGCLRRVAQGQTDKFELNEELRLVASRLAHEHQDVDRDIRRRFLKNFTIAKQLEYSTEEQELVEIFDSLVARSQYLEAESHLGKSLEARPQSLILRAVFAEFLKTQKRDIEGAIRILEHVRSDAHNHPTVLRLLVSCYIALPVPNFNRASVYAEQLAKLPVEDDKLRLELGEFYVRWSTSLKMRRELDPLQEKLRQQQYKELADRALAVLGAIKAKSHEVYYWLAHCYHNKWNYPEARRMIDTAIDQSNKDPLCYAPYAALRKNILTQQIKRREA